MSTSMIPSAPESAFDYDENAPSTGTMIISDERSLADGAHQMTLNMGLSTRARTGCSESF